MSRIVQEKFQVNYDQNRNDDASNGWKSDKSARTKKNLQTRHDSGRYQTYGSGLNCTPPGMNIEDQRVSDINSMRTVTAGTDDVTDNPSGGDFKKGYVSMKLRPTDDMFSREHQDAFYDDMTVDGSTGYLERNNVLDRS